LYLYCICIVCDDVDACPGYDDNEDLDQDGLADACDECPLDAENDTDGDGACGDVDICPGFDDFLDSDDDEIVECIDDCPFDAENYIDGDGLCCNIEITESYLDFDGIDDWVEIDSVGDDDEIVDCIDDCPFDAENSIIILTSPLLIRSSPTELISTQSSIPSKSK
jgi:hypothetical protein